MGELVSPWLARGAPKNMDRRTLTMVESMVRNHLLTVLGSVSVRALTVEDVEGWLEAKAATMAKSSLIKLRSYLAQAFDFGIRRRHAVSNPARIAELPNGATDKRAPRALTAPKAKALLNVADHHRLGAIVTVATTLGLRPGEVTGLEWSAIDFDGGTLTVYQSLRPKQTNDDSSTPMLKSTKTGFTRTLELPAPTLATQVSVLKKELSANFARPDHLIIDVSELAFVDWSGLRGLMHAGVLAEGRVALVSPPPDVVKILETTGLVRSFPIFSSIAAAHLSFQSGTPAIAS